ncbi:DUF721 domain-containing protein [Echinimonas agarilytica]|uniref:DciA family protein n=1 Tax=Echinimonas agarilytica TaxID=1215918 RepID=A0AA41W4U0_9GAMM|nr:DciA family protein [Echinimonas agarilytica]MCM2678786.1 DciA family protein [Echinimonas agarilytica]
MRRFKPIAVDELLQNSPQQIGQLFVRSRQLQQLQNRVRKALDDELAPHCQVISMHHGILTLEVDNPVWQWRLNMHRNAIVTTLRQQGMLSLSQIESKVSPKHSQAKAVSDSGYVVNREITQQSASDLRDLAERVPEPLKSKLLKLAEHEKTKPA